MASFSRTAVVAGTGPGIGAALARAFSKEGYHVALLARSSAFAEALAAEIGHASFVQCDLSDESSVLKAAAIIEETLPPTEVSPEVESVFVIQTAHCQVLCFNGGGSGTFRQESILDVNPAELLKTVTARSIGPLRLSQRFIPGMLSRGKGSVFFTGATAAMRGSANFAYVAIPAFSTKALAESMAREFMPKGIHVAHVILDGVVDSEKARTWKKEPDALLAPASVAASYVMLHNQPKAAWTFELVLRPSVEKW
ncbi:hypothetical protein HDU82_004892 [Entophlyctis luteolus]|nr:hypothetical protein HDU82_004892 [Entophlyctis luteolus]